MSKSETCPQCGASRLVFHSISFRNVCFCWHCGLPNALWPEWRVREERIAALTAEVERLKREHRHLARMAWWFAEHPPGTTVPDWCGLAWRSGEPVVEDEELAESEAEAIRLAAGKEGKS